MIDIIEKLREYAQYAETRSERDTFEATINEITILREDLASAKRAAAAYEAWKFPEDIQALTVENERLREENARLRELLKPFEEAAGKLDDEPLGIGRLVLVTLKDCRAIRAAIREGGKDD